MEPPAAPDSPTTPLQSFPSLCISEPPVSDAPLATHDPLEDLSSSQLLQNSDDESESDDERDGITPSLRTNTLPPQLGALELPSPVFGRSFVDLLDFSTPASTTPIMTGLVPGPRAARQRTPSILDKLRSSLYAPSSAGPPPQHLREPTLTFSVPRTLKDDRRRREGKDEDVWVGVFPSPEEECELGDRVNVSEWGVAEWDEVRGFVEMRGYAIDEQSSWVGSQAVDSAAPRMQRLISSLSQPNLFAHRISDSLPLSVFIIPTDDDSSYELDVLEHLSSAGLRSKAKTMKTIPCVPLVGIVPMNEEWTAVLVERWEELGPSRIEGVEFQGLVEDIVGVSSAPLVHFHDILTLILLLRPSLSCTRNTSPTSPFPLAPSFVHPMHSPSPLNHDTTTLSPPSTSRIKEMALRLPRERRSSSRRRGSRRPPRDGKRRSSSLVEGSILKVWTYGEWVD